MYISWISKVILGLTILKLKSNRDSFETDKLD